MIPAGNILGALPRALCLVRDLIDIWYQFCEVDAIISPFFQMRQLGGEEATGGKEQSWGIWTQGGWPMPYSQPYALCHYWLALWATEKLGERECTSPAPISSLRRKDVIKSQQ